jgi:hypothetical protein
MTETITLTAAQIDAGRVAAMVRTPTWQPTPAEGIELARQLFEEGGRFGPWNEAVRVGRLIGKHGDQVWERYRMGELGLPTKCVTRAKAFAAGRMSYIDAKGVERYVNDNACTTLPYERALMDNLRTKFDGVTKSTLALLMAAECPCCGIQLTRGDHWAAASFDHLVPGERALSNARLLCRGCNTTKLDATPEQLRRVADWMALSPLQMQERAALLPQIEGFRLNGWDGRKQLLAMKKYAAKKAGVSFDLRFEDIAWPRLCPVLGLDFLLPGSDGVERKGPKRNSLSFDRIDPNEGYVAGNVVLVSHLANSIMGNATSPDRVRLVADWFERELQAARR